MKVYKFARWSVVAGLVLSVAGVVSAGDDGVVKGKVIFKGEVPKRGVINTAKDPNCKKMKKKIGTEDVIVNKKTDPTTLRNVMVYVKNGLGGRIFEAPSEPFVLDQVGCQYKPHVIALMTGQKLRIRNSDDTNHNIHFLPKINQEMNFSQPKKGMEKDVELEVEDVFKVKCDVHPWMGAFIKVFDHPFFAVTGKDGTFEIKGLPAGRYEIEAWHEKFGKETMTVEVATGETKEADFTFAPGN